MTDEEHLNEFSKIEIYCQILLGVLRYIPIQNVKNYETEIVKKLKLRNYREIYLLRSCIDVLEDTQYAINETFRNGLEAESKHIGEKYLRLYGVLNAYSLQMQSLFNLIKIFNSTTQREIKARFRNLGIIELRNKIASHTTNYIDDYNDSKNLDFFRLTQTTLTKWSKELIIVSYKSKFKEIDLINLMNEFTEALEKELHKICEKSINSIFRRKSEHRDWLLIRLNYITKNNACSVC